MLLVTADRRHSSPASDPSIAGALCAAAQSRRQAPSKIISIARPAARRDPLPLRPSSTRRPLQRMRKAELDELPGIDAANDAEMRRAISELRQRKSYGVLIPGRAPSLGRLAVVLRPTAFLTSVQADHYCYLWDGARISKVYNYSTGESLDPGTLLPAASSSAA